MIELAVARYLGLKSTVAAPRASSALLLRCAVGTEAPSSPAPGWLGKSSARGLNVPRLLLLEKEVKMLRAGTGLVRVCVRVSAG